MTRSSRTTNPTGRRARHVLLAGLVAVAALLTTPSVAQAAGTVVPTATCYQPNSDGSVSVLLGYVNNSSVTKTVPLGPDNVIYPSRFQGTQPTSFAPGSHPGIFALTLPASEAWGANWWLDGSAVTSGSSVPQCPAGTSLPADGNGLGMTMVMLGAGLVAAVALWVSRRRGRELAA